MTASSLALRLIQYLDHRTGLEGAWRTGAGEEIRAKRKGARLCRTPQIDRNSRRSSLGRPFVPRMDNRDLGLAIILRGPRRDRHHDIFVGAFFEGDHGAAGVVEDGCIASEL